MVVVLWVVVGLRGLMSPHCFSFEPNEVERSWLVSAQKVAQIQGNRKKTIGIEWTR